MTPLTEAEVVAVMEEELSVPWEDVFESIEATPMAAGTIGQVHRATLEGGDRVVVKVQRPNAATDIYRDLGLLELFAEKTADRPTFRQLVDIPAVIEHLSDVAQARARLPHGGGEHRADARGARPLLATRGAGRVPGALERAAPRHGGGARACRSVEAPEGRRRERKRPASCSSRTTSRS